MQKLVQIDKLVIDVSKIAWIETPTKGAVTLHFDAGVTLTVTQSQAVTLFEAVLELDRRHALIAYRPPSSTAPSA